MLFRSDKINHLFIDNEKPLIVEIGCYQGKTLIEMSSLNQTYNFLGLDITYKRVVKTARKIKREMLTNSHVAACDGRYLFEHVLADESILGLCVFFPDPWPKDRHEKNRLLNKEMVELIYRKLKPNGFFWFKTDHGLYYEAVHHKLLERGFHVSTGKQPSCLTNAPYETNFQKLFTEKKTPYFDKVYLK